MKQETEQLLATALILRKKAYAVNAPKAFISSINHDIRKFRGQLAEMA